MKRYLSLIVAVAVLLTFLTGCAHSDEIGEDEITTDFLEDTVFTVSDRRVCRGEWNLYAMSQIAEAESMYGKDIWKYVVDTDGATLGAKLKEDIKEQITYIKIVSSRAEEFGLAINEDDMIDINIQTEDFMNKLSKAQIKEYDITPELVRSIYEDNLLAMKVYENLTLNIDTHIPEEDVRHMVLEYIMVLKDYEDESGEFVRYGEDELSTIRNDMEAFLTQLKETSVERLDENNDERYSVTELVADLATLREKLPGDLPGIAFSMRENEIAGIYETDDAFFILDCVARTDEDSTNEAKIRIIEARQKALFEKQYESWAQNAVIKLNYNIWDNIGW